MTHQAPTINRAKKIASWVLEHEELLNASPTVQLVVDAAGNAFTIKVQNTIIFKNGGPRNNGHKKNS